MSATELERAVTDVLIDRDALQRRIAELGEEISADYAGRDLLLVGVLKGAVFFMADLMRGLTIPCEIDFMAISSYGDSTDSSGVVRILKDLDINIEGRTSSSSRTSSTRGSPSPTSCGTSRRASRRASRSARFDEAGAPGDRGPVPLRRLRDPEPLRDRLRPGLRRALPKPAVRGDSRPELDPGRGVTQTGEWGLTK